MQHQPAACIHHRQRVHRPGIYHHRSRRESNYRLPSRRHEYGPSQRCDGNRRHHHRHGIARWTGRHDPARQSVRRSGYSFYFRPQPGTPDVRRRRFAPLHRTSDLARRQRLRVGTDPRPHRPQRGRDPEDGECADYHPRRQGLLDDFGGLGGLALFTDLRWGRWQVYARLGWAFPSRWLLDNPHFSGFAGLGVDAF